MTSLSLFKFGVNTPLTLYISIVRGEILGFIELCVVQPDADLDHRSRHSPGLNPVSKDLHELNGWLKLVMIVLELMGRRRIGTSNAPLGTCSSNMLNTGLFRNASSSSG